MILITALTRTIKEIMMMNGDSDNNSNKGNVIVSSSFVIVVLEALRFVYWAK